MIYGLPKKLKALRLKYGLSQKQVSERIGVSPSIISGYETGERTPSIEVLLALSYLYKCSTDYLLGRNESVPETPDIRFGVTGDSSPDTPTIEGNRTVAEKYPYARSWACRGEPSPRHLRFRRGSGYSCYRCHRGQFSGHADDRRKQNNSGEISVCT